jgi:hypothetical protein
MPTPTSSNGLNVNVLDHKENESQDVTVGGTENFGGRDTTPTLGNAAEPSLTSGFSVGASVIPVVVKQTGFKDLKSGADHRGGSPDTVKASIDQIANNGGPRSQMKGQRNSKNYNENGKAFRSTNNSPDSDSGN